MKKIAEMLPKIPALNEKESKSKNVVKGTDRVKSDLRLQVFLTLV
jgi:hypothetical protein